MGFKVHLARTLSLQAGLSKFSLQVQSLGFDFDPLRSTPEPRPQKAEARATVTLEASW